MNPAVVLAVTFAVDAVVAVILYRGAVAKGRSGAWCLFAIFGPLGWIVGFVQVRRLEPLGAALRRGRIECECGFSNDPGARDCGDCGRPLQPSVPA